MKHIFNEKEFGIVTVEVTKGCYKPKITIQVENDLFTPKMGVMELKLSNILEKEIVFSKDLKRGRKKISGFSWDVAMFKEVEKDYAETHYDMYVEKAQKKLQKFKQTEDRIKALEEGAEFEIHYKEGEGLQGYTAYGMEAEILEGLDAGEYVSGWGFYIDKDLIHDGKLILADIKEKNRKKALVLAKETGEAQLIETYTIECDGTEIDYSNDTIITMWEVTVWAMPDGSIEEHRRHNA